MEIEIELEDKLVNDLIELTGISDLNAICDMALREMIAINRADHSLNDDTRSEP